MAIKCRYAYILKYNEIYVFIPQHDTEMVGYSTLCHTMMGWSTAVSGCVTLIKT